MSDRFREILIFSLNSWYECDDKNDSKKFEFISNSLMNLAYDEGFIDEVTEIIDELNK